MLHGRGWPFVDIRKALVHSPRMAKTALGRGLGALLGGAAPSAKPVLPPSTASASIVNAPIANDSTTAAAAASDGAGQVRRIALERVRPCPFQPRKEFTA